jgi:hypothetical protein
VKHEFLVALDSKEEPKPNDIVTVVDNDLQIPTTKLEPGQNWAVAKEAIDGID